MSLISYLLLCVSQEASVVTQTGPGSVFLRVQGWMAPLLPHSVETSLVWACYRPCWVRWRQIWILCVLAQYQNQQRVRNSTENKASLDSLLPWSLLLDV